MGDSDHNPTTPPPSITSTHPYSLICVPAMLGTPPHPHHPPYNLCTLRHSGTSRVINDIGVSSDGRMLVAGCADGYLVTWDVCDVPNRLGGEVSPASLMKPRSAVPFDTVCVMRQLAEAPGPYYIVVGTGNNTLVQVRVVCLGLSLTCPLYAPRSQSTPLVVHGACCVYGVEGGGVSRGNPWTLSLCLRAACTLPRHSRARARRLFVSGFCPCAWAVRRSSAWRGLSRSWRCCSPCTSRPTPLYVASMATAPPKPSRASVRVRLRWALGCCRVLFFCVVLD
jgi:hypothetical protein